VRVVGGSMLADNQTGTKLRIGVVYMTPGDRELLRIESDSPILSAPRIVEAEINEGRIPITTSNTPTAFGLSQNVPNPFNPRTVIRFGVPEASPVRLAVYDINGRHVRTLVDGPTEAGHHAVVWNGADALGREVATGVYMYRLTGTEGSLVRRMLLVR
jgi:hypothetical protein